MSAAVLPPWLARLPSEDGLIFISGARRYSHDEAAYDSQYSIDAANLKVGQGLIQWLRNMAADFSAPALELGCGTGLLSLGLIADSPYPLAIISDPSPEFLRITRAKAVAAALDQTRTCFAVLKGEELDRLPAGTLSLIVLRATLHHVLDVEAFLRSASRVLLPGGILAFQEPCMEGCVLMGAMIQFLPALAAGAGEPLSPDQKKKVDDFANAMAFYARRDVDKAQAEDKHLFRVDEVMVMARRHGLDVTFDGNVSFDHPALEPTPGPRAFSNSFRSYARHCMSWDESMMALFDRHIAPMTRLIDTASGGGPGPYLDGVFMCRKVR